MLRNLFLWWKEDILLRQALEETMQALDKVNRMFCFAMEVLLKGKGEGRSIYDMDKEVNRLQIDIRKKILEHLAINPKQDITASLVLITIIIDIERIGDFTKNIVELQEMCSGERLEKGKYILEVEEIRGKLERLLEETKKVFMDADVQKAKPLMSEYTWIAHKCDSLLNLLTGEEGLKAREVLVYGLLFRYLKRIDIHARNICSSVVNPFHKLGYKPE
ncbi:MAG: hypothetical protein DRP75_01540 [Candidatus Omnitrophota bacterium]|nr:MAG: hypothetical protein DRP75_01540 [Candidatus Omnitrophota bacterium]